MKNFVRAILQLCKMHAVMDFDYVYIQKTVTNVSIHTLAPQSKSIMEYMHMQEILACVCVCVCVP